jgi:hypothetical protein
VEAEETSTARLQQPTAGKADATVDGLLEKKHATEEELLEAVFCVQSAPRLYTRN